MANTASIVLTADDKTQSAFASAQKALTGLKAASVGLNTSLAGIGVGLSVGSFAAFVKNSIDAADNLNDLSKKTGVAVEQLGGFKLAADSSGTSLEDVGGALGKLNKYMGEAAAGNKDAAAMLQALGVTAKKPEEALYQLANAFNRMGSEGDKARAFSEVLGKSWQNLAPMLAEGGDKLRALVEDGKRLNPITKEMAEQADKFNDALTRFKVQAAGVGTTIANQLLPALNALLEKLNQGAAMSSRFGFLNLLGKGINPTGDAGRELNTIREQIKATERDVANLTPGTEFHRSAVAKLEELKRMKAAYQEVQAAEALAMNDKYGTGGYKMPGAPELPKIKLPGVGKGAAAKRMSDAEWAAEEAAHLIRTYYQIGQEMDAASAAAFERAGESAQEWQDSLDRANESLRAAAAGYIDLADPIEKYRRQLEEVAQLVEAGLLTPEQALAAEFAIQQQIDAAAGFNEKLKETDDIARELSMTFTSAFEDAIVGGKGLRDILDGIYKDLVRLTIRKTVTEPMSAGFTQMLGSFNLGSFLPKFASGTDFVPRDMLAVVHRGEKIVPAAENRRGGGVTVNMTVMAQDAGSFQRSRGQIQADLAFAVQGARRFA